MENIVEQVEHTSPPTPPTPTPTPTPTPKPKKLKQKINITALSTLNLEQDDPTPASAPAPTPTIINKGTGAGGANTNVTCKSFEQKTENETRLLAAGFSRKPIPGYEKNTEGSFYYLIKETSPTESVVYMTQGGLKKYFEHFFNKELCRHPDEAYLFRNGDKYTLKILEKKNQNKSGSVDTKLMTARDFIEEYEDSIEDPTNFTIQYAFCVSDFLKKDYVSDKKKWVLLRRRHKKYGIAVLFGNDPDYYETLDAWIYQGR
jgi:hypothetical protein